MLPARRPWGSQSGSTRHRRRSWRTRNAAYVAAIFRWAFAFRERAARVIPNPLSASGVSLPAFGGRSAFQAGAPRRSSREGFSLRRLSYLLR